MRQNGRNIKANSSLTPPSETGTPVIIINVFILLTLKSTTLSNNTTRLRDFFFLFLLEHMNIVTHSFPLIIDVTQGTGNNESFDEAH